MGLALFIFILKTKPPRGNETANQAVRFWTKIFGITFVMGVITGIPMEFQFGTNWSRFSEFYGDIVPGTDVARGLAIVEGVGGQLLLAVMVARLISLYGSGQETKG